MLSKIFKYSYISLIFGLCLTACSSQQNIEEYTQQSNIKEVDKQNKFASKDIEVNKAVPSIPKKPKADKDSFFNDSYLDIRLGDIFDEKKLKKYSADIENCFSGVSLEYGGIYVMVENQKITEISTDSHSIVSSEGIKVGDTLNSVRGKLSKNEIDILENPYTYEPIFIHWHDDKKVIGTKYDVENSKVVSISIGYNETLQLMEGCS